MVKGTLNSMTYLSPRKWWQKPFAWFGRFQKKTVFSQYQDGIRFFDFKVRVGKDGMMHFTNGVFEYDDDNVLPINVLQWLCRVSGEGNEIYVRLINDSSDPYDNAAYHKFLFELEEKGVIADHFHLLMGSRDEMLCSFNDGTIIVEVMEPESVGFLAYFMCKREPVSYEAYCGQNMMAVSMNFYHLAQ